MKRMMTLAAVAAVLSTPVWAGNADPVIPEAPVAVPPPPAPVNYGGEWTGFYAGGQIAYGDVDGTGAADGDDTLFGLHAGYDYDFGRFVLGGELDTDFGDIDLGGAATVDNVTRLKLRAGYDLGRTLIYATGGVANVDTSLGSETGEFLGLGVAYQATDQWVIGGEVLEHRFDNIAGSGVDADATTIALRGSFRF